MNANHCDVIRRQIDESNLDDQLTAEVSEHLRNCSGCRRFHDERHELRLLMAGMETVGAPTDFDFRLRARLARERPRNGFAAFLMQVRPLMAAALVVTVVFVAVVVKSWVQVRGPKLQPVIAFGSLQIISPVRDQGTPVTSQGTEEVKVAKAVESDSDHRTGSTTTRALAAQRAAVQAIRRNIAPGTREYSLGSSIVLRQNAVDRDLVVVPVDARSFRVSIDNGRGGAQTISLPRVSFGSQRLMAREASFVPVSSAKGDW